MSTISERRKFILDHIAKDGFVKVSKLAESLGVTQATIRKDLNYLEMQGVLQRAHGSAHTQSQHAIDLSLNTKRLINFEAKQKIAEKAVSLIKNDEYILVASGSTITVFAENLKPKGRLNVVSISVNISAHLGDIPGITVMQVGGILYGNTLSVLGAAELGDIFGEIGMEFHESAVLLVSESLTDKFGRGADSATAEDIASFFGVDGIDMEYGLTCGTGEEASITQKMMQSSQTTIVLADSSKFGKRGFARICEIGDIDILITDSGLPMETRQSIENMGVKLLIAE